LLDQDAKIIRQASDWKADSRGFGLGRNVIFSENRRWIMIQSFSLDLRVQVAVFVEAAIPAGRRPATSG
jgi:hypothetical protein